MCEPINLADRREVFWDDTLIAQTNARFELIPPIERESAFVFDRPDECRSLSYPNIVFADGVYRMYYLTFDASKEQRNVMMRMLISSDGLHWERLSLADGDNIVIPDLEDSSLCVFYDSNPACPTAQKYKALTLRFDDRKLDLRALWCYPSADGVHFDPPYRLSVKGRFDTLNATFYQDGLYHMYLRDLHYPKPKQHVRDVRYSTSPDFVCWSEPVMLVYDDGYDFQMYTNNIMPYPHAEHIRIGMPARYVERTVWTPNDDQFAARAVKEQAAREVELRCGLAVTDMMFICSRDGVHFHRYPEAYWTAGLEDADNWVYGDGFAAYPLIPGEKYDSFFMCKNTMSVKPKALYRYEVRRDGFACLRAGAKECTVITKPLIFSKGMLHLNFSTSGFGHIYVQVLSEAGEVLLHSYEVYGDSIDRKVYFTDGDFADHAGQPIRLRFKMSDARLFSLKAE